MKRLLAALLVVLALATAVPVLGDMMGIRPESSSPNTSYEETAE